MGTLVRVWRCTQIEVACIHTDLCIHLGSRYAHPSLHSILDKEIQYKRNKLIEKELKEWPKKAKAVAAKLKIAVKSNTEVSTVVEQCAKDWPSQDVQRWKILDKLKERFGDKTASSKADALIAHFFLFFNSGTSAEAFADIVRHSTAQVKEHYGEQVKIDDLTYVSHV